RQQLPEYAAAHRPRLAAARPGAARLQRTRRDRLRRRLSRRGRPPRSARAARRREAVAWIGASRPRSRENHRSAPQRSAARARALAASASRFLGAAVDSRPASSAAEISAIASIAALNAASLAFDGLLKPLILRTNWSDAAWISSSVTGGSKLNSVRMF